MSAEQEPQSGAAASSEAAAPDEGNAAPPLAGEPPPAPHPAGSRKGVPMAGSLKDKISKACKGKIRLTLKQKTEIAALHHHEDPRQRKTCRQLAEQYGISERSVRLVSAAKYQDKIAMYKTGGCNEEARIVRADPHPQLTDKLLKWIESTRQALNPSAGTQPTITTTMLQDKALEFASELGLKDFKATKGWVYRWRQRFQKRKEMKEPEPEVMEKEYVNMVLARLDSLTRDLLSHSRMIPDSVHLATKLKHAFLRESKNALAQSQPGAAAAAPSAGMGAPPLSLPAAAAGPADIFPPPQAALAEPGVAFRW